MAVDTIGGILSTANSTALPNSGINEKDFIKLFVNELQFQDPMQPLDNSQFLTQLAQFVSIEQQSEQVSGINNLLRLGSSEQSLELLSRNVQVINLDGSTTIGKVTGIEYGPNGSQLTLTTSVGVVTGVGLSQVQIVSP